MTEKRFKVFVGNYYGVQAADGEVILDSIISLAEADVLVDWLNEIYEENEQLKQQMLNLNEDLDYFKAKASSLEEGYLKLQKENEQLKKRNENLLAKLKHTCEGINCSEKLREMMK